MDHSQLVQLAENSFSGLPSTGLTSQDFIQKVLPLGESRCCDQPQIYVTHQPATSSTSDFPLKHPPRGLSTYRAGS